MQEIKFLICRQCGNIAQVIHDAGVPMMCCGKKMDVITPNAAEASDEKHKPVVTAEAGKVCVNIGTVNHPMFPEHFIQWIYVQTEKGGLYRKLQPGSQPDVVFDLNGEKAEAVYAYCNLHGLWMTEV